MCRVGLSASDELVIYKVLLTAHFILCAMRYVIVY